MDFLEPLAAVGFVMSLLGGTLFFLKNNGAEAHLAARGSR